MADPEKLFDVNFTPFVSVEYFGGTDLRIGIDWSDCLMGAWEQTADGSGDHHDESPDALVASIFLDAVVTAHPEYRTFVWDRTKVVVAIDEEIARLEARKREQEKSEQEVVRSFAESTQDEIDRNRFLRNLLEAP